MKKPCRCRNDGERNAGKMKHPGKKSERASEKNAILCFAGGHIIKGSDNLEQKAFVIQKLLSLCRNWWQRYWPRKSFGSFHSSWKRQAVRMISFTGTCAIVSGSLMFFIFSDNFTIKGGIKTKPFFIFTPRKNQNNSPKIAIAEIRSVLYFRPAF